MVTRADKGNITVVLEKTDYNRKVTELLEDNKFYEKVKHIDYNRLLQRKNNDLVNTWLRLKHIDKDTKNFLVTHNSTLPRAYALPKIHKPNMPFRIIISSINSPIYNLNKWYTNILNQTRKKQPTDVKNSFEFKKEIDKLNNIPLDYTLISLDVVSLFTNLPLKLVKAILRKNWDRISKITKLPKTHFFNGLDLCLDNTYFTFQNTIYKQKFGSPMGAPISPILADFVMDHLVEDRLNKITFDIPFFKRYVDDICTCIPKDKIDEFLRIFNSYQEKSLQFTIELENNNEISFLDTKLIKQNNRLITNWYRKPTWSGRYINFNSNHPLSQKIGIIYHLVDKAFYLGDKQFNNQNLEIIKKTLLHNDFPAEFISNKIDKRWKFLIDKKNRKPIQTKNTNLDYSKTVSFNYNPSTNRIIKNIFSKYHIPIAFKNNDNLLEYYNDGKDKIDKDLKSGLIYQINCLDCNSAYIGQTGRWIKSRVSEHKVDIKKPSHLHTQLTIHRLDYDHNFDFDHYKILNYENNYNKRKILESIYLEKHKNIVVNKRKDTEHINSNYSALIINSHI
ncbi:uncharacterized protein LOC128668677 [Microplitis demolitor]|uniref:uncharacterized protein LOC128668677 n=1 Tax=Microplitis demolitor TaxID=69319 RepID=UPI00235B63F4|nr:uncharacterized protein LOC128668677 [Microplitis demolitor]